MIYKTAKGEVYGPDKKIKADGFYESPHYSELIPAELKILQDQLHDMPIEPMPSDEELMEFARMEHPAVKQNQEAEPIKQQIKDAWDEYVAKMKEAGLVLGDMPEYGGQG